MLNGIFSTHTIKRYLSRQEESICICYNTQQTKKLVLKVSNVQNFQNILQDRKQPITRTKPSNYCIFWKGFTNI
jgi:hypothetical protein